ncbi:MAG: hypothetical protein ACM3NQ_20980 [Bacteroidales bacterium]
MALIPPNSRYPLTRPALLLGVAGGCVTALVVSSALVGFAVFVLLVTVGATWIRDRPAIFPFILAYQWITVTIGYFYSLVTGVFPSTYPPGDIERTVSLSLSGLLLLALGIRLVSALPGAQAASEDGDQEREIGGLSRLFWLVMAVYAIDYSHALNSALSGGAGQVVARVLDFRQVLLITLWWEVLRRREGIHYIWITLAWVSAPLLGTYFSDFKIPLLLLFITWVSFFKPWARDAWRFSLRQIVIGVVVAVALVFGALVWQAGVKKETRRAHDTNAVGGGPAARISLFLQSAQASVPIVLEDTTQVVEGLVERLSYITFFSRVLDHVPKVQPHTNGELLGMAFGNAFTPRFLFPGKAELPSDSVYTQRFAGIQVSDKATSISIGYMAEFYVDWGVTGMMLMVFGYGCWIGLAYWLLQRFSPPLLLNGVLVAVLMSVYQFEHQFIKTFAALNMAVIVVLGMAVALRRPLGTFLDVRPIDSAADADIEEQPA